jgi:hypothetical protein
MNASKISFPFTATLVFVLAMCTGCDSTGSGGGHVSGSVYYGAGYYDPWYYGDYDNDNVIVVPPPSGNRPDNGLRPTHPIASPPPVSKPSPRPMPSIPSTPRPASRPAGRR